MTAPTQEHLDVWTLFPAVLAGRASAAEQERVLQHTAHCGDCRLALGHDQALAAGVQHWVDQRARAAPLPDTEAGLKRLLQRVDAAASLPERQARPAVASPWQRLWKRLVGQNGRGLLVVAVGMQALTLGVLTLGVLHDTTPPEAAYRTLSDPTAAAGPAQLRALPPPSLSATAWGAWLGQHRLRVVDGPRADGAWLLGSQDGRLITPSEATQLHQSLAGLTLDRVTPAP